MDIDKYFTDTKGTGVFASASREGEVNTAIFSRPHIAADGAMIFIMGDNRTHANLQTNPQASFLFMEAGPGYRGSRFSLTKIAEEENDDLVRELCRRCKEADNADSIRKRYVVYFHINKQLPLIGPGE